MEKTTENRQLVVRGEVEVRDGSVALKSAEKIPKLIRAELEKSVEELNRLVREGALMIENVDLSPVEFTADDNAPLRKVPCNANRAEAHWWGITAYLSNDILLDVGLGNVPVAGVAAAIGGGTAAVIVGSFVFLYIMALSAAAGPCGVQADITWVGVPKKIKSRK